MDERPKDQEMKLHHIKELAVYFICLDNKVLAYAHY